MHTFVNFPLTNRKLATAFIKAHVGEAVPQYKTLWVFGDDTTSYKERGRNARLLKMVINQFMQMYPQGKGTKGNLFLRQFYAACHTIKGMESRTRYFRPEPTPKKALGVRNADALMIFNPEEWLPSGKIPNKVIGALVEREIVTGTSDAFALTDYGVRVHQSVKASRETLGRQASINEIIEGSSGEDGGMFYAMVDIGTVVGAITIRQDSEADALQLRSTIVEMLKGEKDALSRGR